MYSSHPTYPLCIRVPVMLYDYYNNELPKRAKIVISETLKNTFIELVNRYSQDKDTLKLIENLQKEPIRARVEISVSEVREDSSLELRKRLEKLEKELGRLLNENAGLKNELESCREQLKKPSDQLEKELSQIQKELSQAKKELENYKYYITVMYSALNEIKKTNDMRGLDKIIQYTLSKIDNTAIDRARLTAQNILK